MNIQKTLKFSIIVALATAAGLAYCVATALPNAVEVTPPKPAKGTLYYIGEQKQDPMAPSLM